MNKSTRLIQLIHLINNKRVFTASELSLELDVSVRTIQRDLRELEYIGVPLYSETGPGGGYKVLNRILPPISFTEDEAISMFFASQALGNIKETPFQTDVSLALNKFYSNLPKRTRDRIDNMQNKVLFWVPQRESVPHYLQELLEESMKNKPVEITYDSSSTPQIRRIKPIGIYTKDGFWYCPAYCYVKQSYRLFRVDRIQNLSLVDQIDEEIKDGLTLEDWFVDLPPKKSVNLKVYLTEKGVRRLQIDPWLERHINKNNVGGGTIHTSLNEEDVKYYGDIFLGAGEDAKVEKPIEMVSYMKDKINKLYQLYNT